MTRAKATPRPKPARPPDAPPPKLGRPARAPHTEFGRWMDRQALTAEETSAVLRKTARGLHYLEEHAPAPASVCELRNGRYTPSPLVMLLIEQASAGEVGLAQWVTLAPDAPTAPKRRRS